MTTTDKSQQESEYFAIHQVRYQELLKQIERLNLSEGAKILDVGCYPLYIFNQLKSQGFDMHGIASEHEQVTEPQIHVTNIEKEKLPFKTNTFELIIFTEVLEHMIANPDHYLKEFHRVLKKGGKVIITTPNSVNLKNRIKLLFGKSVYFPLFQLYETTPENGFIYHRHTREFTLDEVKELLQRSDFSIHAAQHYSAYTPFRAERTKNQSFLEKIFKFTGYLITQLIPSTKDSLLIIGKK